MSMPGDRITPDRNKPDTPRTRGDYDAPHITPVSAADDFRTIALNRVSGTAVMVGAAMALVVQLILNLFGVGFGFTVSANNYAMQMTTNVTTMALLWWAISGVVAAFLGGLTAGRCAGEPKAKSAGWNGLGSWAVSVLIITLVMAMTGSALSNRYGVPITTAQSSSSYANPNMGTNTTAPVNEAGGALTVPMNSPSLQNPASSTSGETTGTTSESFSSATPNDMRQNVSAANPHAQSSAAAGAALISAIALVLGAIAAWVGGCAGAVDPTVRDESLRGPGSFHTL